MKILWHSNAPWTDSGYGQQTRIFAPRLQDLGHEMTISAFFGLTGGSFPAGKEGIAVLGGVTRDDWGNSILEGHAGHAFGGNKRSGLVLTLIDPWVFDVETLKPLNAACWTPVDRYPCPAQVRDVLKKSNAVPIAMSRYGEAQLTEAGLRPLYVPHGIETDHMCPGDRAEARAVLNIPEDAFLVTMVGANRSSVSPTRKGFEPAMEAFREFQRTHTDSILWLHCDLMGREGGIDLMKLANALDYPMGKAAIHRAPAPYDYATGQWRAYVHLRSLYRASDVLLQPSKGEGFGIPIIEAQACGTPVITSDFSAMSELVGPGWLVEGNKEWSNFGESWWFRPSVDSIIYQLEEAHRNRGNNTLRERARAFALNYDADKVTQEHWVPTLEAIKKRTGLA